MSKKTNILLTGSGGFVGASLIQNLNQKEWNIHKVDRNFNSIQLEVNRYECLIHLAGRAHVLSESESDILTNYREANVNYSLKIAELAKTLHVKRFIFVSSIKVNGEYSKLPFNEFSITKPEDAYGVSKLEAEIALKAFCVKHGIEYVIIRPPLIYGPGVKANFKALIKLATLPLPLPFGCVSNLRSFISLDNLNSFISLCCEHPLAANQTFLISDDHDVSLATLIGSIRKAFRKSACLLPCPTWLLKVLFKLVGKPHYVDRLLGDLQVDITKAKTVLGWQPAISFDEGIRRTVEAYKDETSL